MKRFLVLVTLILLIVVASLASAQDGGILTYGTIVQGMISVDNTPTQYAFNGTAGEVVSIRVTGASTGMDPNLTLLSPTGEALAANDDLLSVFLHSAAITYRLPISGSYTIVVNGTVGTFVLALDVEPAALNRALLEFDRPISVTLPQLADAPVYVFNTNPANATTLMIDANPLAIDAYLEVRDANGQLMALLRGDLDNACLSFGPGDQLNEVYIVAAPEVVGNVTLTLGRAPCVYSTQTPPPVNVPVYQVTPINGACTIGSGANFNVRTGPGLQYSILVVWPAQQPLLVVGQSADGQWYAVQALATVGWVSTSVVAQAGACAQLPVMTPVPTVTVTPDTTAEVTATVDPTATVEVTAEVTVVPTVAVPTVPPLVTPEVTAPPV